MWCRRLGRLNRWGCGLGCGLGCDFGYRDFRCPLDTVRTTTVGRLLIVTEENGVNVNLVFGHACRQREVVSWHPGLDFHLRTIRQVNDEHREAMVLAITEGYLNSHFSSRSFG